MAKMPRRVNSKWSKTATLLRDGELRSHVPQTARMNRRTLEQMLDRYHMVYIKPNIGTFGKGVVRIEKRPGASAPYWFQAGTRARSFRSFDAMYAALAGAKSRKGYLVQKGIHLLKHKGRRFDLRIMVQQSPSREWESTGIIGRLAHPRKIVTNYHSGGTPMSADALLGSHMGPERRKWLLAGLKRLGTRTASRLSRSYPGIKEVGLDVALDPTLHPWILEVNTRPDPYIFRKLPDKKVFRKIIRYVRAYSRSGK